MKIGIIVYSQTGNTFYVAQKLNEKLAAAGHSVNLERIMPVVDIPEDPKNVHFEKLPDLTGYDALVFGAPVHAFSLAPVMAAYMKQLPSLQGKKIACFVTKGLRFVFTGGSRAISQMQKNCESKGGNVVGTGIVLWADKDRDNHINEVVTQLSSLF